MPSGAAEPELGFSLRRGGVNGPDIDQGMKRTFYAPLLAAAVLSATGFFTGTLWVLGIAAWVLIGACLIEMIYRP